MRLVPLLPLLTACALAGATTAPADEADCSPSAPCARVTGFSCDPGEPAEGDLPDGALVRTLVAVYIVDGDTGEEGHDIYTPITGWTQDTRGWVEYTCPPDTLDGWRGGNVLAFYDEM